MRKYLILVGYLMLFSSASFAKAEAFNGTTCKPRVPKIEYAEAIQIAMRAAAVENSKKVFIDSANLLCEKNKHFWIITLRNRDTETGQLIIKVYMDGTTETSVMKDG